MHSNPNIAYHLRELEIARDADSPLRVMPDIRDEDRCILDIGCGIGQTYAAVEPDQCMHLVGIDIDLDSLHYGHDRFEHIDFVNANAGRLPFRDEAFDLVVSRVALPYSNMVLSLAEIARILDTGGRVWLTLHSYAKTWAHLKQSLRTGAFKDVVFRSYVIANGVLFHCFGKQVRFPPNGRCESFQTRGGMERALKKAGFADIRMPAGHGFICTARKARK